MSVGVGQAGGNPGGAAEPLTGPAGPPGTGEGPWSLDRGHVMLLEHFILFLNFLLKYS